MAEKLMEKIDRLEAKPHQQERSWRSGQWESVRAQWG